MLTTKEIAESVGDRWLELFPVGRTVHVIVPDAIDWSKVSKRYPNGRIYKALDRAVVKAFFEDSGTAYVHLYGDKFRLMERRVDNMLDTVFLFVDEAEAALNCPASSAAK